MSAQSQSLNKFYEKRNFTENGLNCRVLFFWHNLEES